MANIFSFITADSSAYSTPCTSLIFSSLYPAKYASIASYMLHLSIN
ncbi:hypothetical protein NEOC95_000669 [Neochlamydia sp. AcF95]|nr:hypothetical protein [Neochlamydia sp. AcF95]